MLIGITGIKTSGKDTTADYLVENYGFEKIVLSQPLKDICKLLFNFTDEQLYGSLKETIDPRWGTSPRIIFQYLGTDIFRKDINKIIPNIEDNFWINSIISRYTKLLENNKNARVVISDVRFKNEIDIIQKINGKIIKIIRPNITNNDPHESEKNIYTLECDHNILNDGTKQDLYKKIDDFMDSLKINKL